MYLNQAAATAWRHKMLGGLGVMASSPPNFSFLAWPVSEAFVVS
jgi:hypothetical protein